MELLEKCIFKIITLKNILNNAWIFNSCFINKLKNAGIDNAYEKSWLVIQVYNN